MIKILTKILNDINSVLVPRVCFGCNAHLHRGEEIICTVCRNDIPFTEYNFNDENPIDRMFYGRINIKKASAFLYFSKKSIVQKLIHHLKYKNQNQISTFLGDWYGHIVKTDITFVKTIDMVIPVPLHPKRLRQRGYNQSEGFARRLAFHLNAEYVGNILRKTANTKTQTKKGRIGRWQIDKELYTLMNARYIQNKNILLVDDIITTGATMEVCAQTLQKVRGTKIYLTSMAVVPKLWN